MRLRWIIMSGVGALLIGGGVVANHWLSQPAVVTHVESATTTDPHSASAPDIDLASSYFAARVPSHLTVRTHQEATGVVLERHILASASPEGDQLAITVAKLPSGGLVEVADVALRMRNPGIYVQDLLAYLPDKALAFSHEQDTFEQAVFLTDHTRYASVVVTGRSDRADRLRELLRSTITSWQWK